MAPTVTEETVFRVREIEPERWMLWEKPASTWAWRLTATASGRTRLMVRLRMRYRWRRPNVVADLILMEFGDFLMMRRELLEIRRRAESLAASRAQRAGVKAEAVSGSGVVGQLDRPAPRSMVVGVPPCGEDADLAAREDHRQPQIVLSGPDVLA
jgi:hypothetical protein